MPISAVPAPAITDLTSAKSTLIRPGVVIRSVMPWTPLSSTSSADRKASIRETPMSPSCSSRSLGMTIRVSHSLRSSLMPFSAWPPRRRPSNANGRVDHADGQRAELAGDRGDDGRATGSGSTAFPGGDEDHVGTLEHLLDLLAVVLGGLAADVGIGTRAEAPGHLPTDVELDVGIGHQQGLRIGVDRDELDPTQADLDHPVDGVHTTAADADDLDDGQVVVRWRHSPEPFCSIRGSGRRIWIWGQPLGVSKSQPQPNGYSYVR